MVYSTPAYLRTQNLWSYRAQQSVSILAIGTRLWTVKIAWLPMLEEYLYQTVWGYELSWYLHLVYCTRTVVSGLYFGSHGHTVATVVNANI